MSKFVKIFHNDSTLLTVKDFFDREKIYKISIEDFLNVVANDGGTILESKSNRLRIFESYSDLDKKNYSILSASDVRPSSPLPCPVILFLPADKATLAIIVGESNFKVNNDDYVAFINDKVKDIIESPTFQRKNFKVNAPSATVWMWNKVTSDLNDFLNNGTKKNNKPNNNLFDLTPFVINLQTSVTETGGNFSFSLFPIKGTQAKGENDLHNKKGNWGLDNSSIYLGHNDFGEREYLMQNSLNKEEESALFVGSARTDEQTTGLGLTSKDSKFRKEILFQNIITENDLIFIQFEKDKAKGGLFDFDIPNSELHGQIFDMIGLVDTNSISFNAEGTDITINITGRDMMKLLIDDGTFFFQNSFSNPDSRFSVFDNPNLLSQGDDNSATNNAIASGASSRLFIDGKLGLFFNPGTRNIEFVMNTIVNLLANIEICPSSLFDSYPEEEKTKLQVKGSKMKDNNKVVFTENKTDFLTED